MSGEIVLLAEKPNQAKTYSEAFTVKNKTKHYIELESDSIFKNGAIITWGIGHLLELQPPAFYDEKYKKWDLKNLPIFPSSFTYKVSDTKKQHYEAVKKILKNAGQIYICTDIDREGENIARLIIHHAGAKNKPIKRLWINSLEIESVRKGMQNLLDGNETYNLYKEAQTRQLSDWLIGMNLSPLFSLSLQNNGFNSYIGIGRVLCPTVFLINQRQQEIQNFKARTFYEIESEFEHENGLYSGKANVKEFSVDKIKDIYKHYDIQEKEQGLIKDIKKNTKVENPPLLHSLSTLQTKANKKWKYTTKKVLEIAQRLYEKKVLSYPRTSVSYITEAEYDYLLSNINNYQKIIGIFFEPSKNKNVSAVNSKKVEEHTAIIPTKTLPNIDSLSEEEKNIYLEVLRTTLYMFHEPSYTEETIIITDVNGLEFKSKGQIIKQEGWKSLLPKSKKEDSNTLPDIKKEDTVKGIIKTKTGKETPPKYYTEGTLINAMISCGKYVEEKDDVDKLKEVEGIGTEATRSDIIEKIQKEGYIESKNNYLYVTEKGKILCEAIKGTLLSSPEMTAKWETYLEKIGKGEGSQDVFMKKIQSFINKMINTIPSQINDNKEITQKIVENDRANQIATCPSCNGSIEDKGKFFACSGYKNGCRVSFPKKWSKKTLTKNIIASLCDNGETETIKGFVSNKGNKFPAKLKLNEEYKLTFNFNKE